MRNGKKAFIEIFLALTRLFYFTSENSFKTHPLFFSPRPIIGGQVKVHLAKGAMFEANFRLRGAKKVETKWALSMRRVNSFNCTLSPRCRRVGIFLISAFFYRTIRQFRSGMTFFASSPRFKLKGKEVEARHYPRA